MSSPRRTASSTTPDESTQQTPNNQSAARDWSDLRYLDLASLAHLSPAARQVQLLARQALYQYADAMWNTIKGDEDSVNQTEYDCVAELRDFALALWGNAHETSSTAGDSRPNVPR